MFGDGVEKKLNPFVLHTEDGNEHIAVKGGLRDRAKEKLKKRCDQQKLTLPKT